MPPDSATVISIRSMCLRFQSGSKIEFAKRKYSMFWTASLPR